MLPSFLTVVWNVIGEAVTAVVGKLLHVVRTLSPRRAARSVFNLNRALDLVIVYPPRNEEPGSVLPRVAGEDFMAMIHVLELANAAGFPPANVRMTPVDNEARAIRDDPLANLVLICCPRSNAMTGIVLSEVQRRLGLDADFVEERKAEAVPQGEPKPRQHIHFAGEAKHSETWDVEATLKGLGVQPWRGSMKDWGLIVKCRNPFNETAKAFIIAGIRGIGTWGAACHLAHQARSLYNEFKERDFAAVVEVDYANFRIIRTRLDRRVALNYSSAAP